MGLEPQNFRGFWLEYLRAHAKWQTRCVHYCGVGIILASFVLAVLTGQWWLLGLGIGLNYAGDWAAHFLIEHNSPSAFKHPFWSMASGLAMFALWASGGIKAELETAGVDVARGKTTPNRRRIVFK